MAYIIMAIKQLVIIINMIIAIKPMDSQWNQLAISLKEVYFLISVILLSIQRIYAAPTLINARIYWKFYFFLILSLVVSFKSKNIIDIFYKNRLVRERFID